MRILPAVLDRRPDYLGAGDDDLSLLLAPAGTATVLRHLHERFPALVAGPLTVLPAFRPTPAYATRLRQTCTVVRDVTPASDAGAAVRRGDLGAWWLIADAACFPLAAVDSTLLVGALGDSRVGAVHLVAMARNPGGTTERVLFDSDRRVSGIQRYYDNHTWTFTTGVVCSLVRASALVALGEPLLAAAGSLADFRCALSAHGVPTRDVPFPSGVLDLRHREGLLRLSRHLLMRADGKPSNSGRPRGTSVDPSSRLVGRVALHDGVTIGPGARIVGPAVLGAGAVIAANATVVQCVIGPGVTVPADAVITHQVLFGSVTVDPGHGDAAVDHELAATAMPVDPSAPEDGRRSGYPLVKDALDRGAALVGLIVLSPLLLLIAILVKLESSGSVLYRDVRETRGGRPFRCWKFRTMCSDADRRQLDLMAENEVDGPQFKIEGDPRITRLGKWLRRVSLDELPQLVNVLRGEMSIVGPRPSPFRENQICVPWRDARLSVRAGITGLWQVCRADRTAGDFHQWIHYDVLYVQHLSFVVDLKILIATVLTAGGLGRVPVHFIVPSPAAQPLDVPIAHTAPAVYDKV